MIQCQGIEELKEKYLSNMKKKLKIIAKKDKEKELIEIIVRNIECYVKNEENEYITTQQIIGIDLTFKGWVVKN